MPASHAAHVLPTRFAPLTGRREEIALARRLLQTSARVVTLTGGPGVGKSSVAAAAAIGLARCVSGIWYVDMHNRGPDVAMALAQELKIDPADRPLEAVLAAIGDGDALIVLDNVDEAIPSTSALLEGLLAGCPGARLIVTSREAPRSRAQALVAIPPFPSEQLTASSDAVRLFSTYAASGDASFVLDAGSLPDVLRICRATRGVPLAIELAAAQLQFMDARTLADRMDDQLEALEPADPTERSLRTAVADSWERCSPAERRVWTDLSVLAPGWDLPLGEAMAGFSVPGRPEAAMVLKQLLRRSIVHRRRTDAGVRYELLPAIQQFGAERLDDADGVRMHFANCMLLRLQDAEDHWFSDRQAEILSRLRGDIPNIRRAVVTAAGLGRADTAIGIVVTAWRQAWFIHGSGDELGTWLGIALDAGNPSPYWGTLGHALRSLVFSLTEKPLLAETEFQRAVSAYRSLTPDDGQETERECRIVLASAAEPAGTDDEAAIAVLEDVMRVLGDEAYRFERFNTPQRLVARLYAVGRWDEGRRVMEEIAERSLVVGDRFERSFALTTRASAAARAGNYDRTDSDAREALLLKRGLGHGLGVAQALELLADVAQERAEPARGATLLGCAAARWREAGAIRASYPPYFFDRATAERALRLRLGDPAFERAFAYGLELAEEESIDFAVRNVVETRLRTARAPAGTTTGLTSRETQVASLVADGETNKAIAGRLFVSIRTVESHVQNALVKLGLRSRTELAVWYRESGDG
ncbi:helix-turn-helix transcriptional regulator [Leifsonia sp. SIMBA_070]|uniref:helix-turn-helix transcriptional regulator n=1 Tax=Leifsonia sp. SIMBA_070 TaxID=3085810 RepID=UPI00397E2044